MKEYDVRIAAHEDGTFSIVSAFSRDKGLTPVGTKVIANILRKHYESEFDQE